MSLNEMNLNLLQILKEEMLYQRHRNHFGCGQRSRCTHRERSYITEYGCALTHLSGRVASAERGPLAHTQCCQC